MTKQYRAVAHLQQLEGFRLRELLEVDLAAARSGRSGGILYGRGRRRRVGVAAVGMLRHFHCSVRVLRNQHQKTE